MYFPYLRGRQFELIAVRELLEKNLIGSKVVPIIEPIKPTSTLIKTLQLYTEKEHGIALVMNPEVGDFASKVKEKKSQQDSIIDILYEQLEEECLIKAFLMKKHTPSQLKKRSDGDKLMIINTNRDCMNSFLEVYEKNEPLYTLLPDDRTFSRKAPKSKVIFADRFSKASRNSDYSKDEDQFFSEDHVFFNQEGFKGFSDYSVAGSDYNESGFAPLAVAIHIVYFDRENDNVLRVHHFVSDSNKVGMQKLCDSEFLKRNSLVGESSWEKFMSSIKNINRFHSNHFNLDLLKNLFINSENLQLNMKKDVEILYRARICDEIGLKKEEMGPPPSKMATAGRANSSGISCFYLSNDITTTLHEIRARDLDYITVAHFRPNRDLKIVDLSNLESISPFVAESFDYEWFAINMSILKKISMEIAKPLRRQDSELDYLPAQYIADFVKSLGFDGICYKSTLNNEGVNYAFFDYKKFRCIDVQLYHIKSMHYEAEIC